MTRLVASVLSGVIVCTIAAPAYAQGRGRKPAQSHAVPSGSSVSGDVRVVFSTGDRQIIREHYAPQYRGLPPGLQKKLARTGKLPPGWQKKMQPFPVALERRLEPLPAGYRRGVIDGHAVIVVPGTSVIIDAAVLF